jgi:hypothetical protein
VAISSARVGRAAAFEVGLGQRLGLGRRLGMLRVDEDDFQARIGRLEAQGIGRHETNGEQDRMRRHRSGQGNHEGTVFWGILHAGGLDGC